MNPSASVFIVEDEIIIADHLAGLLDDAGYRVAGTAISGNEALEAMRTLRPDIALLDIFIRGDMDGIDTARIIREELKIPFLFITAHSDAETLARARETEPQGILLKPMKRSELFSAIELALYKSRLEKSIQAQENNFRTLAENITDSIARFDRDLRVIYVNPAQRSALRFFNLPETDPTGKTHREIGVPEPWCSRMDEALKQVFAHGNTVEAVSEYTLDGEVLTMSTKLIPEKNDAGETVSVISISRDITAIMKQR